MNGKINVEARHAARLAAVQALYQMELTGAGAEEVAEEFTAHRFGEAPADIEFFKTVVMGVPAHQAEIDQAIAKCLSETWTLARVDSILRAILQGRRPGTGGAAGGAGQGGDRRICRHRP